VLTPTVSCNNPWIQIVSRSAAEDDEEWGWGDDDGNEEDAIELAHSHATDSKLHLRRQSSGEVPALPSKSASLNGGPVLASRLTPTRPTSNFAATPLTDAAALPRAPLAPSSTPVKSLGLSGVGITTKVASSTHNNGTRRGGIAKAPASAGAALGNFAFQSTSVGIGAPMAGEMPQSIGGVPTRITSLGEKMPPSTHPKTPAPPPEEDDIFASLGLSAKPTFTHAAPAPSTNRPLTAPAPSRWAQTAMSTSAGAVTPSVTRKVAGEARLEPSRKGALGTTLVAPAPVLVPIASRDLDAASGGSENADWGDDADLDDLLDD
jgi:hypothetical protein